MNPVRQIKNVGSPNLPKKTRDKQSDMEIVLDVLTGCVTIAFLSIVILICG